jgi:hypothetical protein
LQPKGTGQKRERRADPFPPAVALEREFEVAVGIKVVAVFGIGLMQVFDDRPDHPSGACQDPT